jgi:two-component system sensor histidine kinase VicK
VNLKTPFPAGPILAFRCSGLAIRVIGTLAVLAIEANRFSPEHVNLINILARQAVTRVELYSRTAAQEQAQRSKQRLERALAIERNFVAATLDSIPALVAVLDTAGRMVRFNRPCEELTGLRLGRSSGGRLWTKFWWSARLAAGRRTR